ncbi:Tap42 interacting protein [Neophaeococcomyces mojaviensis]|uniref:Tap42 interacting protein n=1 Tax=Neophaeococcomyces mojaviensis TaxID=3383035 RepID=A0ACC3AD08_9EURO|nr:Tap42 interacting protein [Knufia sp. JES_112]
MAAVNGNGVAGQFNTSVPSASSPRVYNIEGFQIATQKLPILKAGPIEEMTSKLGIAVPEMIFGDNFVAIQHGPSGWGIKFDAFGALDEVDKTGEKRLKVAYSQEWHKSREEAHDFRKLEEVKPFDWSYTPQDYRGEVAPNSPEFRESNGQIPLELLKRPDPILFFDDVILYEDELADNGIAMLSVKIRVMPARLLLLTRFFMRLDDVLVRVKDTRVYIDYDKRWVIREYLEKEKEYGAVREELASRRDDVSAALRDAGLMAEILPVVKRVVEEVTLPG